MKLRTLQELFTKSEDGKRDCFNIEAIIVNSDEYKAMSDLIQGYADEVDHDSAYSWTVEVLEELSQLDEKELQRLIDGDHNSEMVTFEPDSVYNSDLLEWLAKGMNFTMLDEAKDAFDLDQLPQAIMYVQVMFKERIANDIIELLKN